MQKIQITKEQLQKDIQDLKFAYKVAQKYNCSGVTIQRRMKEFNLQYPQINQVNHNFFKTWSPEMAYCLGFITADGTVHNKRPYLIVEIKSDDVEILNYMLQHIQPDGNIYTYTRSNKQYSWTSSKIMIFSYEIKNDLKQYSVFPNKTGKHKLDFDMPQKYIRDYVRGFFDGDGSVYYRYKLINSAFTCASEQFICKLKKLIGNIGSLYKNKNLYCLKLFYKDSLKLRDFMYYDGCFALQRKKERFFNSRLK